jgi:hypothetical protein
MIINSGLPTYRMDITAEYTVRKLSEFSDPALSRIEILSINFAIQHSNIQIKQQVYRYTR